VTANDRAPARHTDAARGRPQRSAAVPFADYLRYYSERAALDDADEEAAAAAPFYLNGWRALSEHPVRRSAAQAKQNAQAPLLTTPLLRACTAAPQEVAAECPLPYFMREVDHTDAILQQARATRLLTQRSRAEQTARHLSAPADAPRRRRRRSWTARCCAGARRPRRAARPGGAA
jgi:hypothetical protein